MAIPRELKNKLLVEANHACVVCGSSRVQLHHIDGNKENSDESNLIVLCANHHDEAEMSKRGRSFTANLTPEQLRLYKKRQKKGVDYYLPIPPMPYFAHPYPLQANFTGRLSERKELTEWFTKDAEPMFAYVAIGGMGKSALTWYWLHEDIINKGLAPEGIIWWSFYDREARFETFLMKAIQYVSKGDIDAKKIDSTRERMDTLYNLLCSNRFLLVFDGFERVLQAYAGLGSPYRGDEVKEDTRGDFRACIEPNEGTLLQWLASGNPKTKILLTTRLCPKELDGMAGCREKKLTDMSEEDAVDFFSRQGVKGTRAEIENACEAFGYHPLSLRLLSGMILKDPKYVGDIKTWTKHNPLPDLKGEKKEHHILELAYDSLDENKQTLVSKLSAFRNPMAYDAIMIFKEFKSEGEFDKALIELVDRGLLLRDPKSNTYDLHPIVRRYCYYEKLMHRKAVHSQLRDYFVSVPEPKHVESVDDLAPVIELYHHTVNSGRYEAGFRLLRERLIPEPLHYRFAAYELAIDLLKALFTGSTDEFPRLENVSYQAWVLNGLGIMYSLCGRPGRALSLLERQNDLQRTIGDKKNIAIGLSNLALSAQLPLGELTAAESNLRRRIELCHEIEHRQREAFGHKELARLLVYQGRFGQSRDELTAALRLLHRQRNRQAEGVCWLYRGIGALLSSDWKQALAAAKKARRLAGEERWERDVIWAEWLLGAAYLANGDSEEAEKHLSDALARDRRINLVELEPDILLELAKLRFAQGRKEEALKPASEALGIADRCEYRLKQADIHNFLTEFYLDAKDFSKAKEHVIIAKERAACGYKPAMDKAEELSRHLKKH